MISSYENLEASVYYKSNPTPEEIAAKCAEIREGWDETTRRIRMVTPVCHADTQFVSRKQRGARVSRKGSHDS